MRNINAEKGKIRKKYWFPNVICFWILKLNFFRDKKIWIYGCWEGTRYDDNSRYLFEYMNTHHPEIESIWLSPSQEVVDLVRGKGFKAFLSQSAEGIKVQLKAGVYFYTNGLDDISNIPLVSGAKIIGLWHGTGMKNVYYQNISLKRKNIHYMLKRIKDFLFNITYQDYAIATSAAVAKMRTDTYLLKKNQILLTGQPRNDLFTRNLIPEQVFTMIQNAGTYRYILYMPTYRPYENHVINDFVETLYKNKALTDSFLRNNVKFILKLHYLTKIDAASIDDPFIILSNDNVESTQALLAVSDYMITDYSGCCIDFALMRKPLLLYAPDYEFYNSSNGLKKEWEKIYENVSHKSIEEVITALTLFSEKGIGDLTLCTEINKIYQAPELENTCYSENVYNEMKRILKF